jgi:opacity protein-like surface antigen
MKKVLGTALVLSLAATTGFAQGFYIRAGLGYAMPQAGQTIDGTGTPYNGTLNSNTGSFSIKGASFSAGLQALPSIGYMFSDHVGVQLDATIGLSAKKYSFTETGVVINSISNTIEFDQQAKTPFILSPSLVVQTGGEVWNIYSRIGLALPLHTTTTADQIQTNDPGTGAITPYDFTFTVKNSFSFGFTGAAGVEYKISDNISVWGEVNMLSLSVYTKESDLTDFKASGQSQSLSYVTSPHQIAYTKSGVIDSVTQPSYAQPFSNVGINVGIKFNLGGGGHHSSGRRNDNSDIDNSKPFRRR